MDDVQVKGAFLRGYRAALESLGLYSKVIERSSPRVRDALQTPPPTSAWVEYALCEEILRIVEGERGMIGVRKLGHDGVTAGVAPFMQVFVQGLLRLFGISPATIFTHMNRVAGQTTRGLHYTYVPTSESAGVITVALPSRKAGQVDPTVWYASAGGLEIVFETCNVTGHVQEPIVAKDGVGNSAQFRVSWRRRVS
jgi:hypothetical protein